MDDTFDALSVAEAAWAEALDRLAADPDNPALIAVAIAAEDACMEAMA